MFKSLLSLFAVLSLWTVTAHGQEAKTDDSQAVEKKAASDSEKAKHNDSPTADRKLGNVRRISPKSPLRATPMPVETPAPKPGFFSRLFSSSAKATPTPMLMPRATPAAGPTPRIHRRRSIEKKAESESPSESAADKAKADAEKRAEAEKKGNEEKRVEGEKKAEVEKPQPEKKPETEKPEAEKPEAEKHADEQKKPNDEKETAVEMKDEGKKPAEKKADASTPASSKKLGKGKHRGEPSTPAPPVDPETAERNRFDHAKARALEDPAVQELKAKADSAVTDEEGKKALRAYNKALFNKMRKIDDGLKDRIDIMESVILKHLEN